MLGVIAAICVPKTVFRIDGMANALVSLLGVADDRQSECVDDYIASSIVREEAMLLPAFSPVITPKDEKWKDLHITFSHTFKNSPHEYHNGGLWPLVTAFYAASLARRGKGDLARRYADGIHAANRLSMDNNLWIFPDIFLVKSTRLAEPIRWVRAWQRQ